MSNWVAGGHVPRAEVRTIVLDLLSARAGRQLTGPDVGWPVTEPQDVISRSLTYCELREVHTVLPALWGTDMLDRRGFAASAAIALSCTPWRPACTRTLG